MQRSSSALGRPLCAVETATLILVTVSDWSNSQDGGGHHPDQIIKHFLHPRKVNVLDLTFFLVGGGINPQTHPQGGLSAECPG